MKTFRRTTTNEKNLCTSFDNMKLTGGDNKSSATDLAIADSIHPSWSETKRIGRELAFNPSAKQVAHRPSQQTWQEAPSPALDWRKIAAKNLGIERLRSHTVVSKYGNLHGSHDSQYANIQMVQPCVASNAPTQIPQVSKMATSTDFLRSEENQSQGTASRKLTRKAYAAAVAQGLNPQLSIILHFANAKVGMIIRAAIHEADYHPPGWIANPDARFTTLTKCGSVFSKVRPQVIVSVQTQHYLSVPFYTHSGRGLRNKQHETKQEFVSIKDGRFEYFEGLSDHMPRVTLPRQGAPPLDRMTVAHVTYPVPRKYGLLTEYIGDLTANSLDGLMELATQNPFGGQRAVKNETLSHL